MKRYIFKESQDRHVTAPGANPVGEHGESEIDRRPERGQVDKTHWGTWKNDYILTIQVAVDQMVGHRWQGLSQRVQLIYHISEHRMDPVRTVAKAVLMGKAPGGTILIK